MSPTVVLIAIILYIGLLFWLGKLGDQNRFSEHSWSRHPAVYALGLGVYCTSWTFYGLVGTASTSTWAFLPILLGPILLFTIGFPLVKRIFHICQQEHIHSIADFISSRYGKRQGIAATTTLVVLLATVPYISLQLKAVSDTLSLIIDTHQIGHQDITLLIALSMIGFALLFGARQLDVSGYHAGLVSAIAFESVIKLVALIFVAGTAWYAFGDSSVLSNLPAATAQPPTRERGFDLRFIVEIIISACAVLCLPRMFHLVFVECLSSRHLRTARTVFPVYLGLIGLCIFLIANAGNQLFANTNVSADSYVIAIPLAMNQPTLSLVAFLGGFSAATAMIIVATITLSQMLSNDVILPLILRQQQKQNRRHPHQQDLTRTLIFTRRLTVAAVVIFAYLYQQILAENVALTSIGLIAFALVVQLAPAILLGMYWRNCNAYGVYAGLIAGLSTWAYTLMLPLLVDVGFLKAGLLDAGPAGISWLRPEHLFNLSFSDAFSRSVILSLAANILAMLACSRPQYTRLSDRIQALAFTRLEKRRGEAYRDYQNIALSDLRALVSQFVGDTVSHKLFENHDTTTPAHADANLLQTAQQALAGVVGVASSQAMIDSLASGQKMAVEDVVNMFEETTRALRFNQDILFSSFENISSGISVVNAELKIVAWNRRYEEMFNYPQGMLQIGVKVADLVRFNAERGLLGPGAIEDHVQRRLRHLLQGSPYRVVRKHHLSHTIEIKGNPLPGGGYVTTYDDITDFIATQQALEQSNLHLEKRVEKRTTEIQLINENLRQEIELRKTIEAQLLDAKASAEDANTSKSRFLALASHDILQPLNAANLYASALLDIEDDRRDLKVVEQIRDAIASAESIISSLLEIARLDTGSLAPQITSFKVSDILEPLVSEFSVQLNDGVKLHYVPTNLVVSSDKNYLRRIMQNFLSNAVKYTAKGKILVGCRRQGKQVRLCIYDTGQGISETDIDKIFADFYRAPSKNNISGLGLGLAVSGRLAELLQHPIAVASRLQHGSFFAIDVPTSFMSSEEPLRVDAPAIHSLDTLSLVYVDDEQANLNATQTLLHKWSCNMTGFNHTEDALQHSKTHPAPKVLLMDYQLSDQDHNGIQLANKMRANWGKDIPVCIISAAADPELPNRVKGQGFDFLSKPVKPAKLRALLFQLARRTQGSEQDAKQD